jgi:hypothetical protein
VTRGAYVCVVENISLHSVDDTTKCTRDGDMLTAGGAVGVASLVWRCGGAVRVAAWGVAKRWWTWCGAAVAVAVCGVRCAVRCGGWGVLALGALGVRFANLPKFPT